MDNKSSAKRIDICLLRIIMCFCVLFGHFGGGYSREYGLAYFLYCLSEVAVPVFMLISFYLSAESFLNKSASEKIKKRMIRLIIPQVGWAVIYYLIYSLLYFIGLTDTECHFTALIWQMITGHSLVLNSTMWFQVDLILLTLLFFAVSYLLKDRKRIFIALNLLMAVALVMQYSGLNSFLFNSLRYELKYPLGRFCEVLPHAVVGIDLYVIEKKINNSLKKRFALLGATVAVCVLTYCVQDIFPCTGFYYQGFYLIFLASSIYELFAIIPFGKLPDTVKKILYKASGYTLGIYCMHRLMATLTSGVIIKMGFISDISEIYGLVFCVILYVLCYVVSVVIGLIPNRYVKQLVA